LWGEPDASMRASAFGWRAACYRRGGNPPAPACPGGETGKGRFKFLAAAGYFGSAEAPSRGLIRSIPVQLPRMLIHCGRYAPAPAFDPATGSETCPTSLRPAVIGVPSHPEIWNWFSLASIRSVSAVSPRPCRKRSRFSMRAAIFSSTWVFINAFALMLGPVPRRSLRKLGIQFPVWLGSCSMIRPATAVPPQRQSRTSIPIPTRPASSRHHRLPASIRKRLERFTAHPQHMQQHRQFSGHRHHRALLQLLVLAIPRQVQPPPPDRAIDPLGP